MSGDVSKAKVTSEGLITLDYFGRSLLASRETGWFVDLLELKKKRDKAEKWDFYLREVLKKGTKTSVNKP